MELHVEYEASQPKQEVPSVQRCPGEATGANVNRHSLSPTASSSPGHPVSGLKVIPAFADMPRMPHDRGGRAAGCSSFPGALGPWGGAMAAGQGAVGLLQGACRWPRKSANSACRVYLLLR